MIKTDFTLSALRDQVLNTVTWKCFLTSKGRGAGSGCMSEQKLGWGVALGLITEYLKLCHWLRSPRG